MTRPSELRELTDETLDDRLAETKQELCKLRFDHATGQLDHTTASENREREIARITTLIREREIAAAEAQEN